eukprot:SAG11_NODE_502_length_8891_cov_4.603731_3_plen_254_part_00
MNGPTPDMYSCSCTAGYDGYHCEILLNMCVNGENDCDLVNGQCIHLGPGQHTCECNLGWEGSAEGGDCTDIDECATAPCLNGATCVESSVDPEIGMALFQCQCAAGYANGMCDTAFEDYQNLCNVETFGTCNIDIDECASEPCENSATCSESSFDPHGAGRIYTHAVPVVTTVGAATGLDGDFTTFTLSLDLQDTAVNIYSIFGHDGAALIVPPISVSEQADPITHGFSPSEHSLMSVAQFSPSQPLEHAHVY